MRGSHLCRLNKVRKKLRPKRMHTPASPSWGSPRSGEHTGANRASDVTLGWAAPSSRSHAGRSDETQCAVSPPEPLNLQLYIPLANEDDINVRAAGDQSDRPSVGNRSRVCRSTATHEPATPVALLGNMSTPVHNVINASQQGQGPHVLPGTGRLRVPTIYRPRNWEDWDDSPLVPGEFPPPPRRPTQVYPPAAGIPSPSSPLPSPALPCDEWSSVNSAKVDELLNMAERQIAMLQGSHRTAMEKSGAPTAAPISPRHVTPRRTEEPIKFNQAP